MSSWKNRRPSATLILLTTLCAALLSGATAQAATDSWNPRQTTDRYLFEVSLEEFVQIRASRPHPNELDWSSDACSYSPDEPLGYEFTESCLRHDFGYRNYENQGRFTEDNRLRIDNNFRADMYSACAGDTACERAADVYYYAVRQFGASSDNTAEAVDRALSVSE
ncbi:phospholipase [Actinopolyspora sp. BKK1]|uniref:phospholipase n=1 Tax=unclassified Actinopolyspora TaxID=2639451 RepID=UPI00325ACC8D